MTARLEAPPAPVPEGRTPATLVAALDAAAAAHRAPTHGLRFVDRRERERPVCWAELASRGRRVAAGLRALGLLEGERVALLFPTGPAFFDAFFGTLLAGGVPAPLYPPVRLAQMEAFDRRTARMIDAAGAALVLTDERVGRLLGGVEARSAPRLGFRAPGRLPAASAADLDAQLGASTGASPSPDDLALVQFSSGTTREPMPVALTHRALLHQASLLAGHWPDTAETQHSGVSWLPLYHDMGLVGCVLPALLRCADLTLLPPELFVARPATWLRALSRTRATISPAPNFAYGLCVERVRDEELEGVDLSAWRAALNGAEAVSPDTLRAFADRFAPWGFAASAMTPVYGLAEAALAVTFSSLEDAPRVERFDRRALADGDARPGATADGPRTRALVSVGRPVPGFAVEIRDRRARPLPAGRVGRVWVRGPSLLREYLGRPAATARALREGWLDTGDLGFVHDGELFLVGRAKDVLVVRGQNYAPEPVEEAVGALASIRSGCVVAVTEAHSDRASDEPAGGREAPEAPSGEDGQRDHGEALLVFAEVRRRVGDEEADVLRAECGRRVAAAVGLRPTRVVLVEPGALPRTSSGKLRRRETLRLWRSGELVPGSSARRRSPLLQAVGAWLHSRRQRARRRSPEAPAGEEPGAS